MSPSGDDALAAFLSFMAGERRAFALTRPPGHHAGPDFFGGYCFLNNAALAAQALRDGGLRLALAHEGADGVAGDGRRSHAARGSRRQDRQSV